MIADAVVVPPPSTSTRRRHRRRARPLVITMPNLLPLLLLGAISAATSAPTNKTTHDSSSSSSSSSSLLGSLLGPVPGAAQFFEAFWQAKPAVIQRRNPAFYQPVLRSADLDAVLAFSEGDWRLVKRVKGKDGEWWSSSPPEQDSASTASASAGATADDLVAAAMRRVERAHAAFDRGFSLVIDRMDEKHEGVGRLAAAVEAETGFRVGGNVYMTPGGGEGANQAFEAHFDWMDALVLQVEGRKRWLLYDALPGKEQPRPDMKTKPRGAEIGAPFVDFVLEAGDLLYLPSGLIHEAHTLDEPGAPPSLHLTLGVESTVFGSWESLLLELVTAAASADEEDEDDGTAGLLRELRCGAGPPLHEALAASVDPSEHLLRWGDMLSLLLVQLAQQERALRQAVPLMPLLVQGAGGEAAVLGRLRELGTLVRARAAVMQQQLQGLLVRAEAEAEASKKAGRKGERVPRSLGPEGSAGHKAKQRIEGIPTASLVALLERPETRPELDRVLRQLECALQQHAPAVLQRFAAVATRDREGRQARRREKLERLAWRITSAGAGPGAEGKGGNEAPQVYAVGGRPPAREEL